MDITAVPTYRNAVSAIRLFFRNCLYCVIVASAATPLFAQVEQPLQPYSITGFTGVNLNLHSVNFSIVPGYGGYGDNFTSGTGGGFAAGGGAEYYPQQTLFGVPYRLGGMLLFSTFSGKLAKQDFIGNIIRGNEATQALVETSVNSTVSAVAIEPYIAVYPIENELLAMKFGIQAGILTTGEMTRREDLVAPEGVNFETGTRVRNEKTGDIPGISSLLTAAFAGVRYDVPLSRELTLLPEAMFGFALGGVSSALPWKIHTVRAGLSISYRPSVGLPPPPQSPPQSPPPILKETKLTLTATARINGIQRNHNDIITIPVQESRFISRHTFAPTLYFTPASDSAKVGQPYDRERHNDLLKAVATYLRANPNAKLTLKTYFAVDEQPESAKHRAEAVIAILRQHNADYGNITTIYGVNPAKVLRPEMRDEQRRITIEVDGKSVVFSNEEITVMHETDGVTVEASPVFSATELPVTLGGRVVLNGSELLRLGQAPVTAKLPNETLLVNENPLLLLIEYSIDDAAGNTKTTSASYRITPEFTHIRESVNHNRDGGYEQFILGFFDFDGSVFTSLDEYAAERAKQAIQSGKRIEVIGLTDDIGTEEHNHALARRRIAAALAVLGANEQQVIVTLQAPVFSKEGNPNSRTLNRSVVVRIR